MSPAPRVGEIMSPGPIHPAMMPTSGSFPRPPIPHHAFTDSLTSSTASVIGEAPRRASQPALNYALQDSGAVNIPRNDVRRPSKEDQGPQTFAEMGFISKPVQEEGCIVM